MNTAPLYKSSRLILEKPQLALFIASLVCLQLWFGVVQPIETTWYQPVLTFYVIVTGSVLGLGIYLMLWLFYRDHFKPHHQLAWETVMVVSICYLVYGFATEYIGFVNKPQVILEQAGRVIYAISGLMVLLSITSARFAWAKYAIRTLGVMAVIIIVCHAFLPISFPHLPVLDGYILFGLYAFVLGTWLIAGILFTRHGEQTNSKIDIVIGQSLMIFSALAGFRFFDVWHPLWLIFHMLASVSYLSSGALLASLIRSEQKFQVSRYYSLAAYMTMVPAIMVCSGFAGHAALEFGTGLLSNHATAFGIHMQQMYETDPHSVGGHGAEVDHAAPHAHHTMERMFGQSEYNTEIHHSLFDATNNEEFKSSHINPRAALSATFAKPFVDICVDIAHGHAPVYKLISVVPLDETANGETAVIVQTFPTMTYAIAHIRLTTMGLVAVAGAFVYLCLLQVIKAADKRLNLQATQLTQAYEDLKQAEQIREDLTDMVVHDLRNPLAGIMSSLGLLSRVQAKHNTASVQEKRLVTRANTAAETMKAMISDMLNISKMERGQLELDVTTMRAHTLLEDRLHAFETIANQQGIVIHQIVPLESRRFRINADEALVKRVIDNLVSNAIRYTPKGGIITLAAQPMDDMMCIEVSDTGAGISEEKLNSVFEKFVQVSDDNSQRRRGLGLGLAFCKLAIEAHGGKIWVESELNKGTSFKFTLPMAKFQTRDLSTMEFTGNLKPRGAMAFETGPLVG